MSSLSASGVFTEGALSQCVDWPALASQQALADDLLHHLHALEARDARLRDVADGPELEVLAKASLATLMDVFTSLEHYPLPECTPAVVLVRAAHDAYVPLDSHQALSQVRMLGSRVVSCLGTLLADRRAMLCSSGPKLKWWRFQTTAMLCPSLLANA